MKKVIVAVAAALLCSGVAVQNAAADNSLKTGALSLGVAVAAPISNGVSALLTPMPVVQGKYMLQHDLGLVGGLGFGSKGGDLKGTDFEFMVGARKYIKTTDVAPFIGGKLTYDSRDDGTTKGTAFTLEGVLGGEAFVMKQFSVEGSVGFGYVSGDGDKGGAKFKGSNFGTTTAGVSVNYYF